MKASTRAAPVKRARKKVIGKAKAPIFERGKETLERMLAAAETLLVERFGDDFSIGEVSKIGKVSVGSIYFRFVSKEELIRAVNERVTERMNSQPLKLVMRARSRSSDFGELVISLVDEVAELLHENASVMRPMTILAHNDLVIRARGHQAYDNLRQHVEGELLAHRENILAAHPELAVATVYRVAYATFARQLGFGMRLEGAGHTHWDDLKKQVGLMCRSYLLSGA